MRKAYTIPTVRFGKDEYITDSRRIADALEQRHPSPPLHLDAEVLRQVEALMPKLMAPAAPILMPRIPRDILNEPSAEYFRRTRAKRFGMDLDELEKSEKGGEAAWRELRAPMREVVDLLAKDKGGPFLLGKTGMALLS